MRKGIAATLALIGFLACGTTGPGEGPDKVTNRTEIKSPTGGIRIRICIHNGDGCGSYPPEEVKNCYVGADWPGCKED